jgi:hypothetical protein
MATPPGFAAVSLKFVLSGFARPAYCTFGVGGTIADEDELAQRMVQAWITGTPAPNSRLEGTVTMSEATVRVGQDGGEDTVGIATNATGGGTSGATAYVPPNCAVLVHKRSARGGRRGRGRLFIPWYVPEGAVDERGTITGSDLTATQSAMNSLLGNLSTLLNPMVILHQPGSSDAGVPTPVTALTVDPLISTQRRRLDR